jgi:hypothetical protein
MIPVYGREKQLAIDGRIGMTKMSSVGRNRGFSFCRCLMVSALLALTVSLTSCKKQETPPATEAAQKTFAAPADAGKALADAAKAENRDTLLAIFGPGSKDIIYSGDAEEDKASMDGFAAAYAKMNRWRKLDESSEILLVGETNTAFPVPLKKHSSGQWYFDTPAGKDEMLARRVGRNEIAAIDVSAALADAQAEYFAQKHDVIAQYAQKFISDEGQQNGLYWQSPEGKPKSPLGPLVAFATAEGYKVQPKPQQPFHGYLFRMLYKQGADAKGGAKDYVINGKMTGGFAFVAYPAEYGNSGVMTFIVDKDRMIYQRDLGKTTADTAAAMSEFNPDKTWTALKP